jgi:hypothetical protein
MHNCTWLFIHSLLFAERFRHGGQEVRWCSLWHANGKVRIIIRREKTRKRVGLVPACRLSAAGSTFLECIHRTRCQARTQRFPTARKPPLKKSVQPECSTNTGYIKFHCRIDCWGPVRTASTLATSASEQCGLRREVPTGNGPSSWYGSRRYLTRSSVESGSRGST